MGSCIILRCARHIMILSPIEISRLAWLIAISPVFIVYSHSMQRNCYQPRFLPPRNHFGNEIFMSKCLSVRHQWAFIIGFSLLYCVRYTDLIGEVYTLSVEQSSLFPRLVLSPSPLFYTRLCRRLLIPIRLWQSGMTSMTRVLTTEGHFGITCSFCLGNISFSKGSNDCIESFFAPRIEHSSNLAQHAF